MSRSRRIHFQYFGNGRLSVKHFSWRFKLAAVVGLLVSLLVASLVYLNTLTQRDLVEQRRLSELESLGRVVREVSLQFIIDKRPAELDIIYEEWAENPDVLALDFVDDDNLLVVTGRSRGGDAFLSRVEDPTIDQAQREAKNVIERRDGYTAAAFPVFVGTSYLGAIYVEYGYQSFDREVAAVVQTNMRTGALFILVGLFLSLWLASAMTSHLRKLNTVSLKAACGDLNQTIEILSKDEFGTLASSMNAMMAKLRERLTALEETKHELGASKAALETQNTLLHQSVVEAEAAKQIAEAAEEAKTQFVARMSHEIRTPLNGVLGMAELLQNTTLSQEQTDLLDTIQRSGDSLLFIVNDILDFSKIEAGQMTLRWEPVNIEDVLDETVQALAAQPQARSLELVADAALDTPQAVMGDRARLKQVLMNLAGNAIKFTSEGFVRISVRTKLNTTGNAVLRFDIVDSGCGIEQDKLANLFEEFTQVDGSHTRAHEGTGLGLAISRGFVELMGGHIWVDSAVGVGTTFSFEVPLQVADDHASMTTMAALNLDQKPAQILVRSPVLESALVKRLRGWNADVSVVSLADVDSIQDSRGSSNSAPVLIVDNAIVRSTGAELFGNWKKSTGGRIVALLRIRDMAKEAPAIDGVDASVLKPISARRLARAIQPTAQKTESAAATDTEQDLRVKKDRKVLLVDDNATNRKIVELVLKRQGIQYVTAVNGAEAVELFEKVDPDVILMDVSMPVMDGYEATRKIRAIESTRNGAGCTIVGLTAHSSPEDRLACLRAGMDEHVAKPVKIEAIKNIVLGPETAGLRK